MYVRTVKVDINPDWPKSFGLGYDLETCKRIVYWGDTNALQIIAADLEAGETPTAIVRPWQVLPEDPTKQQ